MSLVPKWRSLSTKAEEKGKAKALCPALLRTLPGQHPGDNISFQTGANQAEPAELMLLSCKHFHLTSASEEKESTDERGQQEANATGEDRVDGKAGFAPGIAWHSVTGYWLVEAWVSFPDLRTSPPASPWATSVLNTGFNEQEHVYNKP